MFSTTRQTRARIHLYVSVLICQTAYSIILPLIPFINTHLKATDLQYSLAFSIYYISMLIGSLLFGQITDRVGRKNGIVISTLGLTLGNVGCFTSKTMNGFLISRMITGLFDNMINLGQTYMADITSLRERPRYLAQLESVSNITQCAGPLIAAILSKFGLYLPLWIAVGLYGISFFYTLFFLPESVSTVIEKNQIMATFELVEREQRQKGVSLLDYEESRQIRENFLNSLHQQEIERASNAKLRFNYLMVVAIVCEFFNKWCFGVFDTVVPIYGQGELELDSFTFSMMSMFGSFINIFQTGWLFNLLIKKDWSIPTITSLAGITYIVAFICCMYPNKIVMIVGGVMVIVAYGFAAPASAAIMSAECNEAVQGKGIALLSYGGQSAQILSPLVLNNIMTWKRPSAFYVSFVPSFLLFLMMLICNYVPGGRLAGQVSLQDSRNGHFQNELELNENTKQKSGKV